MGTNWIINEDLCTSLYSPVSVCMHIFHDSLLGQSKVTGTEHQNHRVYVCPIILNVYATTCSIGNVHLEILPVVKYTIPNTESYTDLSNLHRKN